MSRTRLSRSAYPSLRALARRLAALGAVIVAAAGLSACGGDSHDAAVARIGGVAITQATIDHWMSVLAPRRVVPREGLQHQALEQHALGFLISSQWQIDEAAERGMKVSSSEVRAQLAKKKRQQFSGGEAEFDEVLKATGQTSADLMLETAAELASAKLHQMVVGGLPPISEAEIASYYDRHRQRFAVPERRELEITNRKTAAAAEIVRREWAAGRRLASTSKRYWVELPSSSSEADESPALRLAAREAIQREHAIFSAKPNVVTGPVRLRVDYYVFEVKKILPATHVPLAQVKDAIGKQLAQERERRALAAFIKEWRARWTARTDCGSGYVMQKCRRYAGTRTPEDPLAFA